MAAAVWAKALGKLSPPHVRAQPLGMTPENIIIGSDATHKWRAYYWDYFNETEPRMIEYGIPELWLGKNLGMVVLSYEPRVIAPDYVAPRPPQCMIDVLSDKQGFDTGKSIDKQQSSYYTLGFDGYPYPMPNYDGSGKGMWKKKVWVEGMDLAPLL